MKKPKKYQFAQFREKETNQTHWAYYIPAADIISVELKGAVEGSKKVKPLNGYWVKKSAIPTQSASKAEVLSFKEFSQKKPDIQSPFTGEENVIYKAIYDKLNDKFLYFKNGRRNSTKISMQKAYDTYLYDEGQKMENGGAIYENSNKFATGSSIQKFSIGDRVYLNTKKGKIEVVIVKYSDKWVQFDDLTNSKSGRWKSNPEFHNEFDSFVNQSKNVASEPTQVNQKTQKANNYNYLMTLDEYLNSPAIPLLKEYRNFIKKNQKSLVSNGYSSSLIDFMTLEENLELREESPFFGRQYAAKKYSVEKTITENFIDRITNYKRNPDNYVPATKEVIEQNKKYRKQIQEYFPKNKYGVIAVESDETKSNKRAVKNAMDNNIYKSLLASGEISIDRLREITDSVGVRITKDTLSADKDAEFEEFLKKSKVPQKSYEKLKEFQKEVKKDLEPIIDKVYKQEVERYKSLTKECLGKTIRKSQVGSMIPFYYLIFEYDSKYIKYDQYDLTLNSLLDNWETSLEKEVKKQIEYLTFNILKAMIMSFYYVKIPLTSFKKLRIDIGNAGFEGDYQFNFEDGSSFVLTTKAVGAGGYNIQIFHFRYLTSISQRKLPDGSETKNMDHWIEYREVKKETGGNIEEFSSGMIIVFKDEYGDLHNGKIIKKSDFGSSYNVKKIGTNKKFLVSQNQIVS
jgi:hypothetical protein